MMCPLLCNLRLKVEVKRGRSDINSHRIVEVTARYVPENMKKARSYRRYRIKALLHPTSRRKLPKHCNRSIPVKQMSLDVPLKCDSIVRYFSPLLSSHVNLLASSNLSQLMSFLDERAIEKTNSFTHSYHFLIDSKK